MKHVTHHALGIALAALMFSIALVVSCGALNQPSPAEVALHNAQVQAQLHQLQQEQTQAAHPTAIQTVGHTGWEITVTIAEWATPLGLIVVCLWWLHRQHMSKLMTDRQGRIRRLDVTVPGREWREYNLEITEANARRLPRRTTQVSIADSHNVADSHAQSMRYDVRGDGVVPIPQAIVQQPLALMLPDIRRGQLRLGTAADGPVVYEDPTEEMPSIGIAGAVKSGKTRTTAAIVAQLVCQGAGLLVGDPAKGTGRSLERILEPVRGSFLRPMAMDKRACAELAIEAYQMLAERKAPGRILTPSDQTVVLVLDEWPGILRDASIARDMVRVLSEIIQEGPKYRIVPILIAQQWQAETTGGTAIRNLLGVMVVHRCRKDDAQMAMGRMPDDLGMQVQTLEKGEAIVTVETNPPVRVRMPSVEEQDMIAVRDHMRLPAIEAPPLTLVDKFAQPAEAWRTCAYEECGQPLIGKRVDAVYCSERCKTAAKRERESAS